MTFLRRSLLVFAAALVLTVAALLVGLAGAQTERGRAWLAASLSQLLSTADSRVTISGLDGTIPSDMRIAHIAVADDSGTWLEIDNAAITLRLRDLLTRRLTVALVSADRISIQRAPQSPAGPSQPAKPFSLPSLPVELVVERITVDALRLGAPLLGEVATVRISGQGELLRDRAAAAATVQRLDAAGTAQLDFRLTRDRALALHLGAAEPDGRLLRDLLGHPENLPFTVAVHGEGPLAAWRGDFRAEAGSAARVDAVVTVSENGGLRIAANGKAAAQPLLPARLRRLLSEPIAFAIAARLTDDRIAFETLSADAGVVQIDGSGALAYADDGITGSAEMTVADLRPLGAAIDQPLAGRATALLNASGTLDAPRLELAIRMNDLDAGIGAGQLAADVLATRDRQDWVLEASGDAAGLSLGSPALPDALTWTAHGRIDAGATRIAVERLSVRAQDAELTGTGTIDLTDGPRGHGKVGLTASDLSHWRELATLPLAGRLSLAADLAATERGVSARITGRTAAFSTGDTRLDALLGPQVDLQAALKRDATGALALEGLKVTGAHLTATGNGTVAADLSIVDAALDLDAPRLAVLSGPLEHQVEGTATIAARIAGSTDRPDAHVVLSANDLRFDGRALDRLDATVALSDALLPRGTLAATLNAGALNGKLNATFERKGDAIEISRLALQAPGSEMTGALTVRTDRAAASGTLTLRAGDLSPWSTLAGAALAGSADARIILAEKDGQRVDIESALRKLRVDDLQAETVRIEAHLGDVLAKPTGRASVDASNLSLPDLRLDRLRLDGRSAHADAFTLSLDTSGALRPATEAQPLRLSAGGEVSLAPQQRLRLTRLTGRVGEHDIASRKPLIVARAGDSLRIDDLDLAIGEGRVTGSASRDATRIGTQIQIRNVPLSIVQLAMPGQSVSGRIDGTVRLTGPAARPDGQAEFTLRDVRIAAAGDLPPLSATALGTWKGERVDVVGQIATSDGTKLDLRGEVPVRLDPASLLPTLVRDGVLRASAKGNGRLERWAALLPLGEDRISGRYAIDLSVDGTPANPLPRGRLMISEGRYASFAAGTEITDLAAEIEGKGTHFVLTRLSGRDGANGTLAGSGSIDFANGAAFDLRARFADFGFVRRDDLTASGNGELQLKGTPDAATLSGHVRVDRAEVRIPERLPPSIPRLQVIEVNSQTGATLSTPEKREEDSAIALAIDVEIPARTFVRGRGLDSEWRGNVRVTGTTADPQLTGTLETVRGDFSLLGKRFVLGNSRITFTGGETIDPQLAISAEHRTAAIVAQAVITGTPSAPSIKLTSQPELPQDEVLARVLFGRSVTEMTPAQGLELAQAAATLAGGGGPGILDRVRSATGLDRLDVTSATPNANGESSGTAVTAGRYVTDRVFVGVEQGMKSDSTRPKVEVEITPNLSVESSVGNASAGVGVNWKWDY